MIKGIDDFSELPINWVWANLDTVSIVVTGKTPSTSVQDYWDGEIPFVTPSQVTPSGDILPPSRTLTQLGAEKAPIIPKDSVLIVCIGTVGKVGFLDRIAVINQQLNALIPCEFISEKFLYYWAKCLQPWVVANASATVNSAILNKTRLGAAPIPLPPLNEQRRIVAKIEALKARSQRVKEELEAIPALLDQFRQSVLAAAFRGDLTADWRRQDNEEFLGYDFPSTWNKKLLGDVVEGLKQGWSPKCENFPSPSDDIWGVIKTTAVQSLRFVEGENKQLPSHLEPRPDLELVEGDLLITRAGPRARAGVTCLVSSVRPKLIVCDKVYRFRAKESNVLPLYLAYFLNSPSTISLIDELKTGISDSGVNLTQEKFLALPLWFPSIAEQQEIVSRIELFFKAAAQIEQQYQETKAYLEQLDQSILGKAFRGELVPQDPNDEPASVLLERIRTEREKLDTRKKAKGKTEKKSRKAKPEPSEPEQLNLPGFE